MRARVGLRRRTGPGPGPKRRREARGLKTKPRITLRETVARSRLFRIDAVDLVFGNGQERRYEQLVGEGGGVVVAPVTDDGSIILVEEYALGIDDYELGLVKGAIDVGESAHEAALRELREETGLAAKRLTLLRKVTLMPAYSDFQSSIFLATGLYPAPLEGDEPEELALHHWPLERIGDLHDDPGISDVRTLLALRLLEQYSLENRTTPNHPA
jgi:ADP-ribose diphosphatase